MKTKFTLLIACCVLVITGAYAQNIFPSTGSAGIGTTTPDASSLLEIKSTTKGLLISRMTKNQRDAVASPATGLMIYQTNNTPGFYYYDGSAWKAVTPKAKGWSLTGNAGTNPATDFIGTTDAQPLMFKINSNKAGYIDYDVAAANTGFGYQTLFSNSGGVNNTGIGYQTLYYNTTGFANIANGNNALYYNQTGSFNTAIGYVALYFNKGDNNTANGNAALYSNTTGYLNTANGNDALYFNTTGSENTANGNQSLYYNTKGNYNTAAGSYALENNTTGYYNTAVGYYAFSQNQTGYGNTAIGVGTNLTGFTNLVDATAIGYNANVNANNKIVIGTASNNNLTGGYGTWQSFSDGRFKDHVQDNVPGLTFINKLHPVTYNLNAEKIDEFLGIKQRMDTSRNAEEKARYLGRSKEVSLQLQTGFIAQEVEATAKSIGYDFDGVHHPESDKDNYTIGYATFVVPLVKAVQELSAKNDSLQKQIDELKIMMQSLAKGTRINAANSLTLSSASLEQNTPNPFNQSTIIRYTLPASRNFGTAQIVITDQSGKVLKQINISTAGKGMLNVQTGSLAAGTYNYSLVIDGNLIDTKKMVLTK